MGGKVKQAQRTKNNSRPSNSGRSAELLGTAVSPFVGFTTHSDLGIIPLAPGFSSPTTENLPDTFDSSVSSQFQLVFRKMSKKDPITKTKALQEFIELINESDTDIVKTILPLWPKFYFNLANDVDHRVRETAQQAQSVICDKVGKLIAPYLKQLAPVWISSQFDNYAPAASSALTSFRTAFAPYKHQEVYTFCQNEILEYVTKNLLHHTPSTLNNAKIYTPEEAENKYHRIVVCSLKMLSLYLEKMNPEKLKESDEKIKAILQNPKFWSFAKQKDYSVKSAWFEFLYTLLQSYSSALESNKQQVIQIVFQNIDDTNPIILPHVWGCVLLIQSIYNDWHKFLNFKKAIQPKLFSLIKKNCVGYATILYPNLFPFISKLSDETLQNNSSTIKEFYLDLFNIMKQSIMNLNQSDNKSDINAIIVAFYECIRYLIHKENSIFETTLSNKSEADDEKNNSIQIFCENLMKNYVLDVINYCIENNVVIGKYVFSNISILIANLTRNSCTSELYSKLLKDFWDELKLFIEKAHQNYQNENCSQLDRCLNIIKCLYDSSNDTLKKSDTNSTNNHVKFSTEDDEVTDVILPGIHSNSINRKTKTITKEICPELLEVTSQLGRIFVEKIAKDKTTRYASQLKMLIELFNSTQFYFQITDANDLLSAFNIFAEFLKSDYPPNESLVDIAFDILFLLDKNKQMELIKELLKNTSPTIQQWIINRLLSYPLCIEPEIRKILSQDHVSKIILNFAHDFIKDNSKENFNLLHKCFFQIDSGEILIDQNTIEGIVQIMCEPLTYISSNCFKNNDDNDQLLEVLDTCGSFIAQIMPIICSKNVNKEIQNDVFLKLFQFSVDMMIDKENITGGNNEHLSEDTLWEIVTCWQDALSSNDIKIDDKLLQKCAEIINNRIIINKSVENDKEEYNDVNDDNGIGNSGELHIQEIINIADLTTKLVMCSLESITNETERCNALDNLLNWLLLNNKKDLKLNKMFENMNTLCLHFELLEGLVSITCSKDYQFNENISSNDMRNFFRKYFYNFTVIFKLTCNLKTESRKCINKIVCDKNTDNDDEDDDKYVYKNDEDDDDDDEDDDDEDEREYTEDYVDPNDQVLKSWSTSVYENFIMCMKVAVLGDSLMLNSNLIDEECVNLIINLTEKIRLALKHLPENFITELKEKIFSGVSSEDLSSIRILNLLTSIEQYSEKDHGAILLYEDAGNVALDKENYGAYLNIIQLMLPNLPSKSLPINRDLIKENIDIRIRIGYLRCMILNYLDVTDHNEIEDLKIIYYCLNLIAEIIEHKNKITAPYDVFNQDISQHDAKNLYMVIELMRFLGEVFKRFGAHLDMKSWDFVRIALSSWVLSIPKSLDNWCIPKVSLFIASIYDVYKHLSLFIKEEKIKSSTQELTNIIDEWENVFASGVNLILFKSFIELATCENSDNAKISYIALLEYLSSRIEYLDYSTIFSASQSTFKYKTDDIIKFCLENLSNDIHCVRISSMFIIQMLTPFIIAVDEQNLEKRYDLQEKQNNITESNENDYWHLIHKFIPYLKKYGERIEKYLEEFNYKLTDLPNFQPIERNEALPYFYIWDCVIYAFSRASVHLRSYFAATITENKFHEVFLNFLFRSMPIEILKNYDSTMMNIEIFKTMSWDQFKDKRTSIERLACHTYTHALKQLPAVVRKWWSGTHARQKTFIDKLTTNFVSNLICNEELKAIAKHEKHENMQVTVHTSTREIVAIYSIDEAKMELIITLASNYPLGGVKVESVKQIGGRAQSRNLGMQLTIFITHQNGSLFDGLSVWKNNLDKKFAGVEECYICYTVIHQDTCQLPKLLCKTCKKKFHGPCLYKWFTTSNKATCPLCRNIF